MYNEIFSPSELIHHKISHQTQEAADNIADVATTLAGLCIDFASIERVPRYNENHRENDAEHSFMLGIVAQEIASSHFPSLDAGLIAQFALIHDLTELITGDTQTFSITEEQLKAKSADEHTSLEILMTSLPPHTAELLKSYEAQSLPESRFVRLIDKLLPDIVDTLGPGVKVMQEDFSVFDADILQIMQELKARRIEQLFPEESFAPLIVAFRSLQQLFLDKFIAFSGSA